MMKRWLGAAVAALAAAVPAAPASAYLFWVQPTFTGGPVEGDEPGIGQPLPKATPAELRAHMLWNMRAGLNVAALQCQFSPILMTVANYNDLLSKNAAELNAAYKALGDYFKRVNGKGWQAALDRYTTRTYNGFSTMHAQLGFCETASAIGRDARKLGRGHLTELAMDRMREFRNSLVPTGDMIRAPRAVPLGIRLLPMDKKCWDRKGRLRDKCATATLQQASSNGSDKRG
jgi:hypothetical protein